MELLSLADASKQPASPPCNCAHSAPFLQTPVQLATAHKCAFSSQLQYGGTSSQGFAMHQALHKPTAWIISFTPHNSLVQFYPQRPQKGLENWTYLINVTHLEPGSSSAFLTESRSPEPAATPHG